MIYTKTITASKGGSAASPGKTLLKVTSGLIYQFELYFPPGSSGLLHVWVQDGSYQVWPSETGETFFGDNTLISFPDRYFIAAADHTLSIYHYNTDDTYDHQFQLRLGQVSADLFIASFLPSTAFESLSDAINKLAESQSAEKQRRAELVSEYFSPPEV